MTNPLVHALVIIAAVLIPGGLLVYLAWRATRKSVSLKAIANQNSDSEELEGIPEDLPDPDIALAAFRKMYPYYSEDSLRAKNRSTRLSLYKTRPHKKSQ